VVGVGVVGVGACKVCASHVEAAHVETVKATLNSATIDPCESMLVYLIPVSPILTEAGAEPSWGQSSIEFTIKKNRESQRRLACEFACLCKLTQLFASLLNPRANRVSASTPSANGLVAPSGSFFCACSA